jgi:RNA polymerase sigma-54 factor
MALSQRLNLKQQQSLVMTPQLQEAIRLLQMSNFELTAYVEEELEQNPLLERDEPDRDEPNRDEPNRDEPNREDAAPAAEPNGLADDAGATDDGGFDDGAGTPADSMELANADSLPADGDSPLDTDYDNVWDNGNSPAAADAGPVAYDTRSSGSGGRTDFSDIDNSIESRVSYTITLRDHLTGQLNVDIQDQVDRIIGLHLIEMLDEAGRLVGDLDEVSERLGCDLARVEDVLARIQRFDPPGIFARDLKECFEIQLRERDRLDPAMQILLDNLHLFEKYDRAAIMKICRVDQEDFEEMWSDLRSLNPKPASQFEHEVAQPVVPDILMWPHADGGWRVELNTETLPRVLVNRQYYSRISRGVRAKKDQDYIADQLNSANWLIKALHQRATTILRVATEIVRRQDAFFVHGVSHMRPLILRDVAEAISVHESTVSRVTSNKYMASPRGIYELKYFFSSSLSSADGGMAHSAEAVRFQIKGLCDAEIADTVLSDDDIAARLREDGIDIARRTVAKYREAMNIPSSVRRRRIKAGKI